MKPHITNREEGARIEGGHGGKKKGHAGNKKGHRGNLSKVGIFKL